MRRSIIRETKGLLSCRVHADAHFLSAEKMRYSFKTDARFVFSINGRRIHHLHQRTWIGIVFADGQWFCFFHTGHRRTTLRRNRTKQSSHYSFRELTKRSRTNTRCKNSYFQFHARRMQQRSADTRKQRWDWRNCNKHDAKWINNMAIFWSVSLTLEKDASAGRRQWREQELEGVVRVQVI